MLEFTIILDNSADTLVILGPTDLKVELEIKSIDDMCEVFRTYLLKFCQKVHFGDYRIDAITQNNKTIYSLSKDNEGTRNKWEHISEHSTYFDAFEKMCDLQYEDECCPMGYCDCIFQNNQSELCKDCVSMNGYYYDDEDK